MLFEGRIKTSNKKLFLIFHNVVSIRASPYSTTSISLVCVRQTLPTHKCAYNNPHLRSQSHEASRIEVQWAREYWQPCRGDFYILRQSGRRCACRRFAFPWHNAQIHSDVRTSPR